MEANRCDINHLDADVLLPPRKRLLAGLKKQNSDGNSYVPSTSSSSNEFDGRLDKLLRSHLNNDSLSQEEIVEASRSAAEAAIKVAEAARAAADEKASIAAKAVAAAKAALELVANVSEESGSNEKYLKKNKLKKHVQVQMLYSDNNKNQGVENCKTDEELARTLHRAINSSPRISKHCSPSDLKSHRHKRLKSLDFSENMLEPKASIGNSASSSNGNNTIAGEVEGGSANQKEAYTVKLDESISKKEIIQAEKPQLKEKYGEEDAGSLPRKRGRMKQKKLPLSICNFRDQANPKDELKSKSSRLCEEDIGKAKKPLFSVGPSGNSVMPVERTSLWKCQAFKAPACVKQNKVVQS